MEPVAEDYYSLMGIDRNADLQKIKHAFRVIAKKYHPDLTQSKESVKRFLAIKRAYEVLSDAGQRKQYDDGLAKNNFTGNKLYPVFDVDITSSTCGQENYIFSYTDNFSNGILMKYIDSLTRKTAEMNLRIKISSGLAKQGGVLPLTIPVITTCPLAGQKGHQQNYFCPVCFGKGRVKSSVTLSISIPSNVKNGTKMQKALGKVGLHKVLLNIVFNVD